MKRQNRVEARRRLAGTWRSDAKRTIQGWVFPKPMSKATARKFFSIFGKYTWHFSERSIETHYDEIVHRGRYKVLWADENSAVVLFSGRDGENCHHLFFDRDWFFLVAGISGNVEYFKKIDV